jgi:hypothetical protein
MPSSVLDYPFLWKHLTATDQTLTAPGTLHTITINRPDPAGACTITLYDSAAGATADIIAIIAMDSALFVVPETLFYDAELANGLYVEFSAGFTLGDITIAYR